MIDFSAENREVSELAGKLASLKSMLDMEEENVAAATRYLKRSMQAQEILQLLAQAVQQKAHERISQVVSTCLSTVFDDPYEFKVVFERKRGKTEAALRFMRRGLEVDPLTASGGGMIDVAAFALRAACLMLHRPKLSKVLIIDEGFKFVSAQYQENIRLMLEKLASELQVQIIQVTHNNALETGKVINL